MTSARPDRLLDRLAELAHQYEDLERQMADPAVSADGARYTAVAKRHAELTAVVEAFRAHRQVEGDLAAAREMATESAGDERQLMEDEAEKLAARLDELEERLGLLMVPKDPYDDKDVIVEIRAAAGGDEAGLFAGELRDMYVRYAERQGWSTVILSQSHQGIGGIKEAIVEVAGRGAYSHLKHESGVHRVQRVPTTESQGRIHTSTASVAVLPAAEDVDVHLDPNDLRVDVFRSSGPGGQSVNTTDSAVRVTHLPSGLVVVCQDEKSQHQNRDKALKILRSRLLQAEQDRRAQQRADARKGQIGTGDRSEKIRTYNFPQSRVTDHRIGRTVHNLSEVLGGELTHLVDALREAERAAKLAAEADVGEADGR